MLDNLDLLGTIPLIDAVVPEALADRVNNIYRLISQKADAKKKLSTASQYAAELQEDDESILLHGHRREVFGCAWHPSCNIVATGYLEFISVFLINDNIFNILISFLRNCLSFKNALYLGGWVVDVF